MNKKYLFIVVILIVLFISSCSADYENSEKSKIKFANSFNDVLNVFNENIKCEYQEFKLFQDFNEIDSSKLIKTSDGRYTDPTGNVFYTFTDFFGFGEQNVITLIEYKKNRNEPKYYSIFDKHVGDSVELLYENMVSAGLQVYVEHNMNFTNSHSTFYDFVETRPVVGNDHYIYRVGPFSVDVEFSQSNIEYPIQIENMSISIEHCDYNVDNEGVKIYNYDDGMIYSNDMFFTFTNSLLAGDYWGTNLNLWVPENDYKVFIYSKTDVAKPTDQEAIYKSNPPISQISIHFVKDEGIKNYDPRITKMYLRRSLGSFHPDGIYVLDALPKLNELETYPYYTRVFFYSEDVIKED